MPLPKMVARINRRLTNPLSRRFAGRVPPFAIIMHTGRRSGTAYRTPIMAFPTSEGSVVALTYGRESDWVRNVLGAGRCWIQYRRRTIALIDPRVVHGAAGEESLPRGVRAVLRLMGVDDFMLLTRLEE